MRYCDRARLGLGHFWIKRKTDLYHYRISHLFSMDVRGVQATVVVDLYKTKQRNKSHLCLF